jgi:PhnB protein
MPYRKETDMQGVEIDFIVPDCQAALNLYRKIFEIVPSEVTQLPKGQNEVIFTLYGTRFHMLDENPDFGMAAPSPESTPSVWFNVAVPDIHQVNRAALKVGCLQVQPVTELPQYGVSNCLFKDPFGYLWMLHQVHREVSFDERMALWEGQKGQDS